MSPNLSFRSLIVANCNTLQRLMQGMAMTDPSNLEENDWGVLLSLPDEYCLTYTKKTGPYTMQICNLEDPMLPFYMGDVAEELFLCLRM